MSMSVSMRPCRPTLLFDNHISCCWLTNYTPRKQVFQSSPLCMWCNFISVHLELLQLPLLWTVVMLLTLPWQLQGRQWYHLETFPFINTASNTSMDQRTRSQCSGWSLGRGEKKTEKNKMWMSPRSSGLRRCQPLVLTWLSLAFLCTW